MQGYQTMISAGKYEVMGELGRGGMEVVYRVRHLELGSIFALKILRPELTEDAVNAVGRFYNEARVTLAGDAASRFALDARETQTLAVSDDPPRRYAGVDRRTIPSGRRMLKYAHFTAADIVAEVGQNVAIE